MSATSLKTACALCSSLSASTDHRLKGWITIPLCTPCVERTNGLIELLVNRTHAEVPTRLGLLHPQDDEARDRFSDKVRKNMTDIVIACLFSYQRSSKTSLSSQPPLPGVKWRDGKGRFTRLDANGQPQ